MLLKINVFKKIGYGGEMNYWSSVEYFDYVNGGEWIETTPMSIGRSGLAVCYGPDNCIYAIGGSSDGINGLKSCERFDERVGKWEQISQMNVGRGYCSAKFGLSEKIYIYGGFDSHHILSTAECYDARMDKWELLNTDVHYPRVDNCLELVL